MYDVIFDMETGDPDDVMTLLFLISHPLIKLRAVTITPGTLHQWWIVDQVFRHIGVKDIPIGCCIAEKKSKSSVSEFHFKWLGSPDFNHYWNAVEAEQLIGEMVVKYPDIVLLTGAALHNPYHALFKDPNFKIKTWVAQGGFAGDSVVPKEYRLAKFDGKETCPTYNFNGNPEAAKYLLETKQIETRYLVSKNVCHGIHYDALIHEWVKERLKIENESWWRGERKEPNAALGMLIQGMEFYLKKNGSKAFHDPLAAVAIVNKEIFQWREVEVYRSKGQWGSRLQEGTKTFISINVDRNGFFEELVKGL